MKFGQAPWVTMKYQVCTDILLITEMMPESSYFKNPL